MNMARLRTLSISIAIPALLLSGADVITNLLLAIGQPTEFIRVDVVIVAVAGSLLGPVAMLGICLGLAVDAVVNGFSAFRILTLLLIGGWCSLFSVPQHNQGPRIDAEQLSEFLRSYIATSTGAVLFSAVLLSWASVIIGSGNFYPESFVMILNPLLSVVVLGGAIMAISYPLLGMQNVRGTLQSRSTLIQVPQGRAYTRYILALLVIWLIVGNGIAIFFDVLELVPRFVFVQRGLEYSLVLKDIGDLTNDGAVIQILFGGIILGLLFTICLRFTASD